MCVMLKYTLYTGMLATYDISRRAGTSWHRLKLCLTEPSLRYRQYCYLIYQLVEHVHIVKINRINFSFVRVKPILRF